MSDEELATLKKNAQDLTLLYVEDNKNLEQQATKVFKKFFNNVITANSAEDGLVQFKEHQPDIVITDINMSKLNGLEMSKIIKKLEPSTKIIITSAFDDKEYLFEAINANVSKYLKKPIKINHLTKAIAEVIDDINFEKNKNIFQHYVRDVFQHQDNILILLKENEILIANKKCLDFFSQESLESFREFFLNFNKVILQHNNFLYNHDDIDWLKSAKESNGRLFNVKIADKDNKSRHFILKAYKIPNKEDTYILSFDDITELNLLVIYDKNSMKKEKQENQKKTIFDIFEIIKRNNSNIRIYNSYKGLSISNIGILADMSPDEIIIQTSYPQLKAATINKNMIIESELLPTAVLCDIKKISFETGQATITNYKFIEHMPSQQESIRVEPEDNHKITLFYENRKINADVKIVDMSVTGAKVNLSLLPAGFKTENELIVDMVFGLGTKPQIINTKSKIRKFSELKKEFEIILCFENDINVKKLLTHYIANRQMALIREFKEL